MQQRKRKENHWNQSSSRFWRWRNIQQSKLCPSQRILSSHCWHRTIEGSLKCTIKSFKHAKVFSSIFLKWKPNDNNKFWKHTNDRMTLPFKSNLCTHQMRHFHHIVAIEELLVRFTTHIVIFCTYSSKFRFAFCIQNNSIKNVPLPNWIAKVCNAFYVTWNLPKMRRTECTTIKRKTIDFVSQVRSTQNHIEIFYLWVLKINNKGRVYGGIVSLTRLIVVDTFLNQVKWTQKC